MNMFHVDANFDTQESEPFERTLGSGVASFLNKADALGHELRAWLRSALTTPELPSSLPSLAKKLYEARRAVDDIFDFQGFSSSPAWDIMLDLFEAQMEGKQISVSSACVGAACPSTTALRWLKVLDDLGLVERMDDPTDNRCAMIRLTEEGRTKAAAALEQHS